MECMQLDWNECGQCYQMVGKSVGKCCHVGNTSCVATVAHTIEMSSDGCTRVQLGPTGGTCGRGSEGFSAAAAVMVVVAAESDEEGCWDW